MYRRKLITQHPVCARMERDNMGQFLRDHPRLVGVLFTLFLYLSQVGTVLANSGGGHTGP